MILKQDEVAELESLIDRCSEGKWELQFSLELVAWLNRNPQIMCAAGLTECVTNPTFRLFAELKVAMEEAERCGQMPLFRTPAGSWVIIDHMFGENLFGWKAEPLLRYLHDASYVAISANTSEPKDAIDGFKKSVAFSNFRIAEFAREMQWFGIPSSVFSAKDLAHEFPLPNEILETARRYVNNPLADPLSFVSPRLWLPGEQEVEKNFLQDATTELMRKLKNEGMDLRTVHWKDWQDVVAEVLRASGMEIHVVKNHPQGGRDIIGRIMLPGNLGPLTLAVEVKQEDVVDRPEVQTALQQNAHFPALMFVTSGRFTSGVIREARKPENRMRLFLKDGVAIRDMIRDYPLAT
jgi:hypothetical protein